jgi:hypothetical protein
VGIARLFDLPQNVGVGSFIQPFNPVISAVLNGRVPSSLINSLGSLLQRLRPENTGRQKIAEFLSKADDIKLKQLNNTIQKLNRYPRVFDLMITTPLLWDEVLQIGTRAIDDLDWILGRGTTNQQIAQLMAVPGMSIAELRKLLSLSGMTPAKLSQLLLNVPGMSIVKLKALLTGSMTVDRLIWLFNVPGMTIAKLDSLLAKTNMTPVLLETLLKLTAKDIPQLDRLLGLVTDAKQLATYLGLAGGNGQAARLESILQLAQRQTGDGHRVAPLLNIAGGNAATFRRLANAAPLFRQNAIPPSLPVVPNLTSYSYTDPATGVTVNYVSANLAHMLDRHTYEYFNFTPANIRNGTSLWPLGTTPNTIADYLGQALTNLSARGQLPTTVPGQASTVVGLNPGGFQVTVGIRYINNNPRQGIIVGQFFPDKSNPGLTYFKSNELEAFKSLLVP